eukprot:564955-Prorocentrum_minimum.AAC.1
MEPLVRTSSMNSSYSSSFWVSMSIFLTSGLFTRSWWRVSTVLSTPCGTEGVVRYEGCYKKERGSGGSAPSLARPAAQRGCYVRVDSWLEGVDSWLEG